MGDKLTFKSTAEIKVPEKLLDQVLGQDEAVNVMKKAAKQRRHILLIGEPGTGKSLLGNGLAELLPHSELKDVVSFPNINDENTPLIRELPAGEGRKLVAGARMKMGNFFSGKNMLFLFFVIIAMMAPWYALEKYQSDVIFAAFFIGGMIFLASFVLFINIGRRMNNGDNPVPKVIVDNFNQKKIPFFDATGGHAGALLGDILHDPFQCFFSILKINKVVDDKMEKVEMKKELDPLFVKHKEEIINSKEKTNHEAIFVEKENIKILGETDGSISPVDILSCNRYDHDGSMIKLTTSENNELIVTPEHKIAIWKHNKIEYFQAKDIKKGQEVVAQAEDIIIDEQDIINTYDERQQEQCKLYYQYLDIKSKNPTWGYKRIAKSMGQLIGKTRWWHSGKHIPVPIQTCNWLKERKLLPLKLDNPKLPLISKILGATFGDGGVFENLNGIFLSSSELEAVKEFGRDIEELGRLSKDENSRIIEGGEYGHSWCYQNTNRNIIRFFVAIGAPKGNKTNLELKVPQWIKFNKKFEDEFWGSFLGNEISSPKLHKEGNRLTSVSVGIVSSLELGANRTKFLSELREYLEKNRVKVTSFNKTKYKDKTNSKVYRILISITFDNVILFLMNIKINYCKYKKDRFYKAVGLWATHKKKKYYELISEGNGAEYAMEILRLTPNSLYLLLNHFGEAEA